MVLAPLVTRRCPEFSGVMRVAIRRVFAGELASRRQLHYTRAYAGRQSSLHLRPSHNTRNSQARRFRVKAGFFCEEAVGAAGTGGAMTQGIADGAQADAETMRCAIYMCVYARARPQDRAGTM